MEVVDARAVTDDEVVRRAGLQFRDLLPCIASPVVKPGPTVPVTVFAVAAELLPVAASAAAATAPSSKDRVRVIILISCDSVSVVSSLASSGSDGSILEGRDGDSHGGDPRTFRNAASCDPPWRQT